jgi:hypothetical protein
MRYFDKVSWLVVSMTKSSKLMAFARRGGTGGVVKVRVSHLGHVSSSLYIFFFSSSSGVSIILFLYYLGRPMLKWLESTKMY